MTNYREQFEAQLPLIEQSINSMPGDPATRVPGLTKDGLLGFCRSFSGLLNRVDEATGVDFAALAYSNTNVPDHLISTFGTVVTQAGSGTDHFIQTYLATLLDLRNRLEIATGASANAEQSAPALRRRLSAIDRVFEEGVEKAQAVSEKSSACDLGVICATSCF